MFVRLICVPHDELTASSAALSPAAGSSTAAAGASCPATRMSTITAKRGGGREGGHGYTGVGGREGEGDRRENKREREPRYTSNTRINVSVDHCFTQLIAAPTSPNTHTGKFPRSKHKTTSITFFEKTMRE